MSKKNREAVQAAEEKPNLLADYFWANLIFFAFVFTLAWAVWQSCEAPGDDPAVRGVMKETFKFILMLFGGGFLLVTVFDAAYEFFAARAEGEGAPDSQA